MSKMIIMQGLPASGKSTKAKELLAHGNTVRINRDLLRTMLHFDKWTGQNESKTRAAARHLAGYFLDAGMNVIIDDTNLNPGTLQGWVDLAKFYESKIEYCVMNTPIAECLERDAVRENKVGDYVIYGMAMQNGLYPKPEKGIVICDLDGTLCDITHRLHHVKKEPKDWKSFFAGISGDTPRQDVLKMLLDFKEKEYEVFLVSARPDGYRKETEAWLEKVFWGFKPYKNLFMRRAGDRRPDTEVKLDILNKYFKDRSWIHKVIDDRPSVVKMWRDQGLDVIDVGDGVDF